MIIIDRIDRKMIIEDREILIFSPIIIPDIYEGVM